MTSRSPSQQERDDLKDLMNVDVYDAPTFQQKQGRFHEIIRTFPRLAEEKWGNSERYPLHQAARLSSSFSMVKTVYQAYPGAIVIQDKYGETPLHHACSNSAQSSAQVIPLFVENYPEGVNEMTEYGWMPLHLACHYCQPYEVIHFLVTKYPKATREKDKKYGKTPLDICQEKGASESIIALLSNPEVILANQLNSDGAALLQRECYESALVKYVESDRLLPNQTQNLIEKAYCYEILLQFDEMETAATNYVDANAEDGCGHHCLAVARLKQRDPAGAFEAMEAGLDRVPQYKPLRELKDMLERQAKHRIETRIDLELELDRLEQLFQDVPLNYEANVRAQEAKMAHGVLVKLRQHMLSGDELEKEIEKLGEKIDRMDVGEDRTRRAAHRDRLKEILGKERHWLGLVRRRLPHDINGNYMALEEWSCRIEPGLADQVQRSIAALPQVPVHNFYPKVIISYATGFRSEFNDYPGKLAVAGVVKHLFESGIECYSDLMTPGGYNWEEYMLRINDGETTHAQVIVVLMTRAFFQSVWCLQEVDYALRYSCVLLPVRVEDVVNHNGVDITRDETSMWPKPVIDDWADQKGWSDNRAARRKGMTQMMLARKRVRDRIVCVSSIPPHGTLLSDMMESVMDDLVNEIKRSIQTEG